MSNSESTSTLLRQARLWGRELADVRWREGVIAAIAPALDPLPGESVIEARGGLLLPGLIDHHCHLFATAKARQSVHCGPPEVASEQELRLRLQAQAAFGAPVRGVGFHDSVCEGLDRRWLDQACGDIPVRVQHRSGMLWIYNSAAIEKLSLDASEDLPEGAERGPDKRLSGRFYNLDQWLGERWPKQWPQLDQLSADYARYGVTAVTDTGVNNGPLQWQALRAACEAGDWRQRIRVMGSEQLDQVVADTVWPLMRGQLKLYLREAALPDIDSLIARIGAAHHQQRGVAIHCVTLVELHFALAAVAAAGPAREDRIEHASVADDAALERIAELGLTVVSQPHFIAERGDQYRHDVEPGDRANLYRAGSLLARGIPFAAGSDAPYGSINPWRAMLAAVRRETSSGVVMNAPEALTPEQALALFCGTLGAPGAGIAPLAEGQPADLCLLDRCWEQQRTTWSTDPVALTVCAGNIIFDKTNGPIAG